MGWPLVVGALAGRGLGVDPEGEVEREEEDQDPTLDPTGPAAAPEIGVGTGSAPRRGTEEETGEMMKIMPIEFPSRAGDPDQRVLRTDEIDQYQEEDADHHLTVEDGPGLVEEIVPDLAEEIAPGLAGERAPGLEASRKEAGQTQPFNRNCCNSHKEEVEEVWEVWALVLDRK